MLALQTKLIVYLENTFIMLNCFRNVCHLPNAPTDSEILFLLGAIRHHLGKQILHLLIKHIT